jgi:hypothetical protein
VGELETVLSRPHFPTPHASDSRLFAFIRGEIFRNLPKDLPSDLLIALRKKAGKRQNRRLSGGGFSEIRAH